MWILFAFGSALFAGLTSILAKCGIKIPIPIQLRRSVPLLYLFFMDHGISGWGTTRHRKCFCQNLDISDPVGLATGASWLCYYRALQDGLASVVVPIDKLSMLVTILFSYLVFHEKLGKRSRGSGTDCGGNAWDAGVVSLLCPSGAPTRQYLPDHSFIVSVSILQV